MTQGNQPAVVLYTHPDCAFSAAARMEYRRSNVEVLEIDVSREPDKIPDLLQLTDGERLTPVIVDNGKVIIGFKGGT